MLEELELLVGKIEECSSELDAIEVKVDEKEINRLKEIVEIAKKGLKYFKITEKKTDYLYSNCYSDPDITYFDNMKGIFLLETVTHESRDSGNTITRENGEKLYLMNDGTFKVFEFYRKDTRWQNDTDEYEASVSENQNILEWNIDEIVQTIKEKLEERLEKLGNRTKTQKSRLEKLEKLEIK